MTSAEIERLQFTDMDKSLKDQRVQLAKTASEKLGYTKLAKAIAMPGALLFTLRELGIEPLRKDQVEAYKLSKVRHGMWNCQKVAIQWWLLSLVLMGAFLMTMHYRWGGEFKVPICAISLTFFATSFGRGLFLMWDKEAHDFRSVMEWQSTLLEEFTGNVPEYVLERAIRIKDKCPEVKFKVEYLTQTEQRMPPKFDPDPFLVAYIPGKNQKYYDVIGQQYGSAAGTPDKEDVCYIDVWDEKEYEKSL